MRIVLDENMPRQLLRIFAPPIQAVTVQQLGLAGTLNGALVAQLEGNCAIFVTADKNLRYQQNLTGRTLSIVELPTNRRPVLDLLTVEILAAIASSVPGSYIRVDFPPRS